MPAWEHLECRFGQGSVRKEARRPAGLLSSLQKTQGLLQTSMFCLHLLGALLSTQNARASRTSDMPGTSALSSHPHPHVTAQVSFSMLPPYTAREEGSRVSVGRHLPSRSHLCLDRVHCCRLDSDRRTRHRKQPPAHLTVSTSSCTWRRRL